MILYTFFSAVSLVSIIPFLEILFSDDVIPSETVEWSWTDTASLKANAYYALGNIMKDFGRVLVLQYFCIFLCVSIFLKSASRYLSSYFIAPLEQNMIYRIRERVFTHLARLSLPFYTQQHKGNLISVLVSDAQVVQEAIIRTIQSMLRDPLTMLTFLGVMLFISWKMTLFTLLVLPLTGFFINIIAKRLKRKASQGQEILGELIAIMDEFLGGIRIVKIFGKEQWEIDKYNKKNQAYTDVQISLRRQSDLASPLTEFLSIIIVCIIILYGGMMILGGEGELKGSEFIGFIAVFSQFLAPIKTFSTAISKIQKGIAAYERIEGLLEEKPLIQESPQPHTIKDFEGAIRFDKVSFSYDGEVKVLKEVSFEVKKGETLAIVGHSGGGKSTLVDLIPRFYDPQEGTITIDGRPLKHFKLRDLRRMIGYVTQEGILFHDTVRNNIAYGLPDMRLADIQQAAKIANAHDFIAELPTQYDTLIGERGLKLSGGQRQRVSIARAVLHNPSILILDEATSALDTASEQLVQKALEGLMKNRTSIVIAHRLSTILNADQIIVLEKGKIVERGKHHELLELNGAYKRLYDLQFAD